MGGRISKTKLVAFLEEMRRRCDLADEIGDHPAAVSMVSEVDRRARLFGAEVPLETQKLLFPEVRFV